MMMFVISTCYEFYLDKNAILLVVPALPSGEWGSHFQPSAVTISVLWSRVTSLEIVITKIMYLLYTAPVFFNGCVTFDGYF